MCKNCYLVKHRSQLADKKQDALSRLRLSGPSPVPFPAALAARRRGRTAAFARLPAGRSCGRSRSSALDPAALVAARIPSRTRSPPRAGLRVGVLRGDPLLDPPVRRARVVRAHGAVGGFDRRGRAPRPVDAPGRAAHPRRRSGSPPCGRRSTASAACSRWVGSPGGASGSRRSTTGGPSARDGRRCLGDHVRRRDGERPAVRGDQGQGQPLGQAGRARRRGRRPRPRTGRAALLRTDRRIDRRRRHPGRRPSAAEHLGRSGGPPRRPEEHRASIGASPGRRLGPTSSCGGRGPSTPPPRAIPPRWQPSERPSRRSGLRPRSAR